MVVKKSLRHRLSVYRQRLAENRIAGKLGGAARYGYRTTARYGKALIRRSKGGVVSFFTDPRGYVNHILFVFLMLFVIAFFGPAIYDFSIIAVMGFLGVLKMVLQFFLLLFEFPINTGLEMLSGMLNALAGIIGASVGTWHLDINGDGAYTSLYHLVHNVVLEVPNVYLSNNFWDYTIVSYFTNWGSTALPSAVTSVSNHAAAVSNGGHVLIGHNPDMGWLNKLVHISSWKLPFA